MFCTFVVLDYVVLVGICHLVVVGSSTAGLAIIILDADIAAGVGTVAHAIVRVLLVFVILLLALLRALLLIPILLFVTMPSFIVVVVFVVGGAPLDLGVAGVRVVLVVDVEVDGGVGVVGATFVDHVGIVGVSVLVLLILFSLMVVLLLVAHADIIIDV